MNKLGKKKNGSKKRSEADHIDLKESKDLIPSFEVGWRIIYDTGIKRLFEIINSGMKGRISTREFVIIYTTVYNMCLQQKDFQHDLYNRFCSTVRDYLLNDCRPRIFDNDKHGEYMLIELVTQYRSYRFFVKWMVSTFGYLDRQYVKRFHKSPLKKVAVKEFKEIIFVQVKAQCIPVALELIEKDRDCKAGIDRTVLHDFIAMFIDVRGGDLKTYKEDFEKVYLQETTKYYLRKARIMLDDDEMDCSRYLRTCEAIIEAEQQRELDYLHHCTHTDLLRRLYAVLLVSPQQQIITMPRGGVYDMIQSEDMQSLSLLFKLYSMVPNTLAKICAIVSRRIQDEGIDKLQKAYQQKDTKVFVETLIALYEHHEKIISQCFKNHADFSKALKDGYSVILNTPSIDLAQQNGGDSKQNHGKVTRSICELLATYTDFLMRVDGGIKLLENELYHRLDKLVKLFAYIHDKDVFLEFYRKQLAKRLLTGKSASEHAEQTFISQLKLRCGAQFTSKLDGMIKDIGRSRDHELNFSRFLSKHKKNKPFAYEFNCKVLTSGFWPSFHKNNAGDTANNLLLPRSMKKVVDYFESYFKSLHQKRLLTWIHDLGTVSILAHFHAKSVVLEVSTLQACMLLILNQIGNIRIVDMTRMLGVDGNIIKKQLKPLCSKKYHVLNKSPLKGYDVKHSIAMNEAWNPPNKRYRIPTGVHRMTAAERTEAEQQVFGDRRLMLEAAIVRIMKTRKSYKQSLLIADVTQQLMHRFHVEPNMVKDRITDLMDREYLERDADDHHLYHYVA
eukprot:CAMPEP_0202690706 /NCGR_PEP_ID=MMETSP1385-20130828/5620_1 /ASSEMBLY_ACC=CAM_ASM_000861 /TAXON_ID=933848 /ORGANISM="Elphidium margaritaceum" /LENGTH=784 /DNA_ID=CAMNT_0049345997 /DNA_START=27 /DNA_END=2381 /DNA_ORIENTATION=+